MARILNLGSINIDYVYTISHFVKAGETLQASSRQIFPGGKGLNQSIAIARAGGDVAHAGMVGADGISLLDILRSSGVDTSLVGQSKGPSGHTIIQVTPDGQNSIILFPGANQEIEKSFVDRALLPFDGDDILVLQNEVSSVDYAIKAAKAKKMRIAFNVSPIGPEVAGYPLDLVDWFLLNEIEGQALTGESMPDVILDKMAEKYPNACIVLTLGEDGVLCRNASGNTYSQKSHKVQVVDTTAAGDTFTGYFMSAVAMGQDMEKALSLASAAAAISVSKKGAAVSIPKRDEVEAFVNN